MRFAVIGNPIDHSLSPIIHQHFAKQTHIHLTYEKIKAEASSFEEQVSNFFVKKGKGLNITLPFKQKAYQMATAPSERCLRAGSANTLWMKDNQLQADNTDGVGLVRDVSRHISLAKKRILILGAGGAARGIIYPLLAENIADLTVTNRTAAHTLEFQKTFPQVSCVNFQELKGEFDLIINATSINEIKEFNAIPSHCFVQQPFCYDLSYRHQQTTPFVHYVSGLDCPAVDGLGMLVEQAAESFSIWHGIIPNTQSILEYLRIETS